eukprot:1420625-Pleurochrysis_carterae.AAC.1
MCASARCRLRLASLRALAAIANFSGMRSANVHMRCWDFVAAHLQGDLEQDQPVYCHAPPGCATLGSDGCHAPATSIEPFTAWPKLEGGNNAVFSVGSSILGSRNSNLTRAC